MEMKRCGWVNKDDDLYRDYHDDEWGVPEYDSRALFEKFLLDGFQAGLSWYTILVKRDNFRKAFHNFDPVKISNMTEKDVERLMQDKGIVRNRLKIEGAIKSAKVYLDMEKNGEPFADYLWAYVDNQVIINAHKTMADVPTKTELSEIIAKDMKKRGFKFCGPTIVYAFMQAVGMVNDHATHCPSYQKCIDLAKPHTPLNKLKK